MRRVSRSTLIGAAILLSVLILASLYYPKANPSLGGITSQTTAVTSSKQVTNAGASSTTSSFTTIMVSSTSSSSQSTFTGSQLTISIIPGASIALFGPSASYYDPGNVTIHVGTTVTWVNNDNYTHGVDAYGGAFYRGSIPPRGGTYSFTFETPGAYKYHCTIHSWMVGEIVVISA